ncbi:MAG: hypothetical protein ABI771_08610 [Betaproteobacteria bacterium]
MIEFLELIADPPVGHKPKPTAAQQALRERTVMSLNTLQHGDYYLGLLDDMTLTARWHGQKRRFVCRMHIIGQPVLKAAPHVADLGMGCRFAPISRQEVNAGIAISDFALETTR